MKFDNVLSSATNAKAILSVIEQLPEPPASRAFPQVSTRMRAAREQMLLGRRCGPVHGITYRR